MRGLLRTASLLCAFIGLLMGAGIATGQTTAPVTQPGRAVVIDFHGEVDQYNANELFKRFATARRYGADTIILRINTYGGLVTAGLDISRFLKQQNDLHVIAYIDQKAISAGAMISLACNEIVMQPGSLIGDCAPIVVSTNGGLESMGAAERAKMESPILEDFENSAARNGYDPLLVQSMVSVGRVVHWVENASGERRFVDGPTYAKLVNEGWHVVPGVRDPIDSAESLLTASADLALKLGLAKGIEASPETLAERRSLTIVTTLAPASTEWIVTLLGSNAVRVVLMSIFLLTLSASFSHPGHGGPEVIAVTSLALLIGVPLLTGYAQLWEIFCIFAGIVLIALEVFVIPGFGVAGIGGILLLLFGLVMTWVGDEPIGTPGFLPSLPGTWAALRHGVTAVTVGMFSSLILWVWLQRFLPRLPFFNRLILSTGAMQTNIPARSALASGWPAIGARGRVISDLRPGGTAAFHDTAINDARIVDVISEAGFIVAGTEIIVRHVEGTRVLVGAAA